MLAALQCTFDGRTRRAHAVVSGHGVSVADCSLGGSRGEALSLIGRFISCQACNKLSSSWTRPLGVWHVARTLTASCSTLQLT